MRKPPRTKGFKLARAAYKAAVYPAGPEPMMRMFRMFMRSQRAGNTDAEPNFTISLEALLNAGLVHVSGH